MKFPFIFFFFILFLNSIVFGQYPIDSLVYGPEPKNYYHEINSSDPFTGSKLSKHYNGKIKSLHFYKNGLKDSTWYDYFYNGKLSLYSIYSKGDQFFCQKFDSLGNMWEEDSADFINCMFYRNLLWTDTKKPNLTNIFIKNPKVDCYLGKLIKLDNFYYTYHGQYGDKLKYIEFYKNGNIRTSSTSYFYDSEKSFYIDTLIQGHENGQIKLKSIYNSSGNILKSYMYDTFGNITNIITGTDSPTITIDSSFIKNGKLVSIEMAQKSLYANTHSTLEFAKYDTLSGLLQLEYSHLKGSEKYREYYKNGNINVSGQFNQYIKDGIWFYYDSLGVITKSDTFLIISPKILPKKYNAFNLTVCYDSTTAKYGMMDSTGKKIVPCIYNLISYTEKPYYEGYLTCQNYNNGFITADGNIELSNLPNGIVYFPGFDFVLIYQFYQNTSAYQIYNFKKHIMLDKITNFDASYIKYSNYFNWPGNCSQPPSFDSISDTTLILKSKEIFNKYPVAYYPIKGFGYAFAVIFSPIYYAGVFIGGMAGPVDAPSYGDYLYDVTYYFSLNPKNVKTIIHQYEIDRQGKFLKDIVKIKNQKYSEYRKNGDKSAFSLTDICFEVGDYYRTYDLHFYANQDTVPVPKYLDSIVDFLKTHKEIDMEIDCHFSNYHSIDKERYEMLYCKYSQAKARCVMNYLISQGIEAKRLKAVGMCLSKPLVSESEIKKLKSDDDIRAANKKNERFEFVITKIHY